MDCMRVDARRGNQIALLNILRNKSREKYLTLSLQIFLDKRGRDVYLCAFWNLIHCQIIPHTGASTSEQYSQCSFLDEAAVHFTYCSLSTVTMSESYIQNNKQQLVDSRSLWFTTWDTNLSAFFLWEDISVSTDWIWIILNLDQLISSWICRQMTFRNNILCF